QNASAEPGLSIAGWGVVCNGDTIEFGFNPQQNVNFLSGAVIQVTVRDVTDPAGNAFTELIQWTFTVAELNAPDYAVQLVLPRSNNPPPTSVGQLQDEARAICRSLVALMPAGSTLPAIHLTGSVAGTSATDSTNLCAAITDPTSSAFQHRSLADKL